MRLQLTPHLARRVLVVASVLGLGLAGPRASAQPSSTPAPPTDPHIAPEPDPPPDPISDADADYNAHALDGEDANSEGDTTAGEPVTGTVRAGIYGDSDHTRVERFLAILGRTAGSWVLGGTVGIDAVTSASLDVRSSPELSHIDVITSASGRSSTSGGEMTDRRYQVTGTGGWTDGGGGAASVNVALAKETDYTSVSAGLNGSYDILDRNATLLGGVTVTDSWIASVLDRNLHEQLLSVGWSAGLARVLTRDDAVRLRYDGQLGDGYHASPYRNVRFGDWHTQLGDRQVIFTNTLGSADGLPEHEPTRRLSHALVLEWVHSLALGVGLHPQLRAAHDSWGVDSLSASLDLRVARAAWRMEAGYRYYRQSRADFFEDKYVMAPAMYDYYTSDKDLGDQRGHLVQLHLSRMLIEAEGPTDTSMLFELQVDAVRYRYPGFALLPTRDSLFASVGLTWEL